eukprot:m.1634570 g.1634570  ORF g.1634570 m.1634570 type:complete len:191 (-) comp25414_c0_seq4:4480-5052(-)
MRLRAIFWSRGLPCGFIPLHDIVYCRIVLYVLEMGTHKIGRQAERLSEHSTSVGPTIAKCRHSGCAPTVSWELLHRETEPLYKATVSSEYFQGSGHWLSALGAHPLLLVDVGTVLTVTVSTGRQCNVDAYAVFFRQETDGTCLLLLGVLQHFLVVLELCRDLLQMPQQGRTLGFQRHRSAQHGGMLGRQR